MMTLIPPPPVCKNTSRGLYDGVLLSLIYCCVFVHIRGVPELLIKHIRQRTSVGPSYPPDCTKGY